MGSATREALAATRVFLASAGKADFATGEQLLSAGRVIGDSAPLRSALVDATSDVADRVSIVDAVFAGYSPLARTVLGAAVSKRWSRADDLLAGLEELGFRVLALSASSSSEIADELFTVRSAILSDAELELAVSSKLGTAESKASLVRSLLGSKASKQTLAIVEHLVQQPRGRRVSELFEDAANAVADERGFAIATVTTASPLAAAQLTRLTSTLTATYGREIHVNHIVDPAVLGGLRVQIADDIIDGTIATRLTELRLQLAS